ncbi:MAG: NUDIX domain-containing protein [Promethearchaeota archaeon]
MSYPKEVACHFIGVGGVIFHNTRVLLVKLNYGPAKGRWLIPGGLVDPGETLREAIKREILEETGQNIRPLGIIGVRSMVRTIDNLTDLYCIFLCQLESEPKPLVRADEEINDIRWISMNELHEDSAVADYTKIIVTKARHCQLLQYDLEMEELAIRRPNLKKYEHFWTCL